MANQCFYGAGMDAAEKILRRIEAESERRFLPIVGRTKGELLESVVRGLKPEKALEIGTLTGYSAIMILRSSPGTVLTTLEADAENAERARKNLGDAGLVSMTRLIPGDALKTIHELKGRFGFVFIDAEKNQYLSYLRFLEKFTLLEKGAVILADNVKLFPVDVRDYLEYVRGSGKFASIFHAFGNDGMEVSRVL